MRTVFGTVTSRDLDRHVRHLRRAGSARCRSTSGRRIPKDPADSDFVYRQAIRAKAFDALRGLLPAASQSNVGIYGTGQATRRCCCACAPTRLPEARGYADLMLTELRKVIPSFLKRVDLADRGGAWSDYFGANQSAIAEVAARLLPADLTVEDAPTVTLIDFDPDAEVKLVTAALYAASNLPEAQIEARVRAMAVDDRIAVLQAYAGDRTNRRHKPGRALERTSYRFDILSDYGAFRDLQRHRMLTIEWQKLTPDHHFVRPDAVDQAGARDGLRRVDGALGQPLRRDSWSASRTRRPTPWPWPTGCGTSCR